MLTRARIAALFLVSASFLAGSMAYAIDVDLTTAGSSGTINGADFVQTAPHPTGTDVIKSFVRLQANSSERRFNTDCSPLNGELNDIKAGTWTHSVSVSALTPTDHNGSQAIQFLLDINQTDSKSL